MTDQHRTQAPRRIVLSVTSAQSLVLMNGIPEYLAGRGWDVHVVTSGVKGRAASAGVTYHDVRMAREPSLLADLTALVGWILLLRRLRPTTVVAGTPKAGLLGIVAARLTRVPSRIYMLRGLRLETEAGARRHLLGTMERITASASTRVLAVSHSLREQFVRLGLCPADKVLVLGAGSSNGVAVHSPDEQCKITAEATRLRTELGLSQDQPVLGFVGRLSQDKGLPVLFTAMGHLRSEMGVQLLLVGPEEPSGFLGRALSCTGLELEQVTWVGQVSDVHPSYAVMDVLCLPTRREGFPNVVLEAAVQGVPTVASRVTGVVDAIVECETGLLFRCDDADDLTAVLRTLLPDHEAILALGEKARDRAEQLFERNTVWTRTVTFFEEELTSRARAKVGP